MILDASALVAAILDEEPALRVRQRIATASGVVAAAPTVLEAAIVLSSRMRIDARAKLAGFLEESGVEVIEFTARHYREAAAAWLRYGKGRHPAALNFGDCMAYAVARVSGLPLLYVGNDFAQTDIESA
ncbi:MAG: type II toxin-antitoxin system VapC family toxin [Candidatus Solibacter usitatus]|nr:type II toxin-antitoxin system VapC family toxin [Candidatus Solibacter usitatus]